VADRRPRTDDEPSTSNDGRPAAHTRRPAPDPLAEFAARPRGRTSIVNTIADEIRRQVASGELRPGARLPNERELARHFDVSSPTVREAMRVLQTMGIVEVRHGSGTYVTANAQPLVERSLHTLVQLENVTLEQVLEVRLALRDQLARAAVERATDDELDALEAAEQEYRAAPASERVEAALRMLTILSGLAHNPLLQALDSYLNNLIIQFQRIVFADRPPEFWDDWGRSFERDRRRLLAALRRRDAEAAVRAMRAYHESVAHRLTTDPALTKVPLSDPALLRAMSGRTV